MAATLTRRQALFLGAGALLTAPALALAGCSTRGEFDDLVGRTAQKAWEALVAEGWLPFLKESSGRDGTPGTVVRAMRNDEIDPATVTADVDAEGTIRDDLEHVQWKGVVEVWLAGMAMIPPQITLATTQDDALAQLKSRGFTNVNIIERGIVNPKENVVVSCDPAPLAWARLDEEVTLTVASRVEVPDITGMSPIDATVRLRFVGLKPDREVTNNVSYAGRNPVVISTDPAAGEMARVGSTIKVEYSEPLDL